jgi:HEAT repeat protein
VQAPAAKLGAMDIEQSAEVTAAKAVAILVNLLRHADESVRSAAVFNIYDFASSSKPENRILLKDAGAVPLLSQLATDDDKLKQKVASTIRLINEGMPQQVSYVQSGLGDDSAKIMPYSDHKC